MSLPLSDSPQPCASALLDDDTSGQKVLDDLFANKAFRAVAQETAGNHGTAIDLEKFSENFNRLMDLWEKDFPFFDEDEGGSHAE